MLGRTILLSPSLPNYMDTLIDIGPATLERLRPDLVIVRFKPGTTADPASFLVSMSARRTHFSDTPHAVVLIAPDDVGFSPGVLDKDHYKDQGMESFTLALAVVSGNESFTSILQLYYALHPAPFPVKLFAEESRAFAWANEQLAVARKPA
jgi:hypothetical protein